MLAPQRRRRRKKHKEADNSNDPIEEEEEEQAIDPNSISTSDAETIDGAEPEKDTEKNDPPEVREEEAPDKRKKYTREEFLARNMGRNENHGYRNTCLSQASPSSPKKKSTTTSFVSG